MLPDSADNPLKFYRRNYQKQEHIELTKRPMNFLNQYWSIPIWITSRSYFTGTEKARTIITNARWATHIVLEELSSDMWNTLPERFTLQTLKKPLAEIGIDIDAAEHLEEVENFLESLRQEGCLVLENAENPQPVKTKLTPDELREITPVKSRFNVGLNKEGILPNVGIELTYRCNEKCVHCFNPRYKEKYDATCDVPNEELTTAEIKNLLNEMYEMGVYSVAFSGGEPSLRTDLFEILDEVKRLKFAFTVSTNGQMSEEKLHKLASYYPAGIGISIYSANPEIHDATTRIKGSFEKSVQALRLLHELGISISIKSPLMKHTVHGFQELLRLCDELKAAPAFDNAISPSTDGNQDVTLHQILDKDALTHVFRERRLPLYIGLETPTTGIRMAAVDDTLCGAGFTSLGICPDGTTYPCNGLPINLGNVRNGGLRKIWEESEALKAWNRLTAQDTNECGLYHKCLYCNYCAGLSMLTSNDLLTAHKASCDIAGIRRDMVTDLKEGIDPLVHYEKTHGQPFGHDLTFTAPQTMEQVPSMIEVNHSGEDFVMRVNEVKRNGNPIRKGKTYEPDSPEDLYHRGELRKDNSTRELLETGR